MSMGSKKRYVCLTIHTELIHDDKVWQAISRFVDFLTKKKIHATWFSLAPVHHFYQQQGYSADKWSERLLELNGREQLIEQHTHFYGEGKGPYDTSVANIKKRLLEDRGWLNEQGLDIQGFCAGGFAFNERLALVLAQNDYQYDCSVSPSSYPHLNGVPISSAPCKLLVDSASFIEIPTMRPFSLKESFSGIVRPKHLFVTSGEIELLVVYLHDWSLKRSVDRLRIIASLDMLLRQAKFVNIRELLELLNRETLPSIRLKENK